MTITLALKQEIERIFDIVPSRSTSTELCFVCPEPGCGDTSGNRSVNLKTGQTGCWRCGKGGNFLGWARHLGYDFSNEDEYGISSGGLKDLPDLDIKTRLPPVKPVQLPKGFTLIGEEPDSVYSRLIAEMAERKNLRREDFVAANVGFTRIDPKWEAFAVFPVVDYGIAVYWQGRTYVDVPGETTKRFPGRDEVPYGARYWVYNIDEVREKQASIVIVVESILNVLSLKWKLLELGWDNVVPVCVFKHKVSTDQWQRLGRISCIKEVCLMFDHDAIEKVWDSSRSLTNQVTLSIAEMPMGTKTVVDDQGVSEVINTKFDPNDDVEAAIDAFEARKLYTVGGAIGHALNHIPGTSLAGLRT